MANIKSAKKRISTIERRKKENKLVKSTISTYVKKFKKMIEAGKIDEAEKFSKEMYAYIDSACSKGILHKNCASRKIGRLASMLFKAKATAATVETVEQPKAEEPKVAPAPIAEEKTKKAPAKKAPAKATTTTKTTTKKAPAKKTTK